MNAVEGALFACTLLACIPLLVGRGFRPVHLVFALILLPALLTVVPRSTQFLTVDEKAMVSEPISFSTSTLKQWSNGAFRTTDIIIGPVMHLLRPVVPMSEEQSARVVKALHWFLGFCMLVMLVMLLKPFGAGSDGPFFPVIILAAAMLLPTCAIAFNMCNYDLYSMILAALSLALVWTGFHNRAPRILLIAVAIATLAAQEKLIATPVLWFAIFIYVAERLLGLESTVAAKTRFMAALRATVVSIACVAAIIAASYAILIALRSGMLPSDYYGTNPVKIILPVITPLVILLRGMGGAGLLAAMEEAAKQASPVVVWTIVAAATVATMALFVISMTIAIGFARRPVWSSVVRSARRNMHVVNYVLLAATVLTGIVSTYSIHGYWAPAYPVASGHYVPGLSFNGAVLHFGAVTGIGHHILLFGWAYAVFYNAMPSAMLICMLIAGPWRWFKNKPLPLAFEFLAAFCLTAPAFYALGHIPLQNRYFNLFLLLLLLVTMLRFIPVLRIVKPLFRYGIGLAFIVSLFLELLPFRPAFGLFRPIWSDFGARQDNRPAAGVINPTTLGGGEELMLAGETLKQSGIARQPGGVRLYHNHYGAWLGNRHGIAIFDMSDHTVPLTYTGRDYYIVDRLSVVQGWLAFPDGIDSAFAVAARGFTQAWVYKGDVLAKQGFSFR
jgi:hypothetical protein